MIKTIRYDDSNPASAAILLNKAPKTVIRFAYYQLLSKQIHH